MPPHDRPSDAHRPASPSTTGKAAPRAARTTSRGPSSPGTHPPGGNGAEARESGAAPAEMRARAARSRPDGAPELAIARPSRVPPFPDVRIIDRTPVPWKARMEGRRAAASRRRATERAIAAAGGAVIAAGATIAAVLPPSPLAPKVVAALHALPARVAEVERRATGLAAGLLPSGRGAPGPWAAARTNSPPIPPLPTSGAWFPPPTRAATHLATASPTRRAILAAFPPTATVAPSATAMLVATAWPVATAIPSATAAAPDEASPPAATAIPPAAAAAPATPVPSREAPPPVPTTADRPAAGATPADASPPRAAEATAVPVPPDAADPRDGAYPTPTPDARPRRTAPSRADAGLLDAIRESLVIGPENAAIAVVHLETGLSAGHNDDRVAVPASLYKVGVLAEAYRQIEAGQVRADEPLRLLPADWAPGAGILQGRIGTQVTVADALRLMIGISDNVAAHALVRRIGVDRVNENNQRLGLAATRYYVDDRPDTTTAADMARLLGLMAQGKVAGAEATARMIDLMRQVQPAAWLPKGVPTSVPVAHKSGQLNAVRNDAGIVYGPTGPYVVVVLTDNRRNPSLGEQAIVSVARTVHAYFAAGG